MVIAKPSNDELREKIRELVSRVDLDAMGVKAFVKLLSKEFADEPDLKPRKDFIKEVLTEVINEQQQAAEAGSESDLDADANEQESEEENSEDGGDDDEDAARTPKKKSAQAGKRRGGGGGGLSQEKEISDKLATFLGKGKMMSRTAIVKQMWEYIREHNLQNPSNKREIMLDKPMSTVFGCQTFTMFTMNKYIGAHIHPFKPVDLTSTPKTSAKKRKLKAGSASAKKKRKADILPRPQVVSKLWEYIKANNLQNPDDKREILCDDKLRRIMKNPKISMFKMNICIGEHLLEKLDRSEYQHEVASDAESSDSD